MLVRFTDEPGKVFTVESTCGVLSDHGGKIASSTYRAAVARIPSIRARRDEWLATEIARVHADNYGVFGARKVWLVLHRQGIAVAPCTVERVMRQRGLRGAVRGRARPATVAHQRAHRPTDPVQRPRDVTDTHRL